MLLSLWTVIIFVIFFLGMLACIEMGFWIGRERVRLKLGPLIAPGFGTVEAAIFALFGLLVTFTYSGAVTRFDERRYMVVQEADYIGSVWQRIDLLPQADRAELKSLLRQYLDSRLVSYQILKTGNTRQLAAADAHTIQLERKLWQKSVAAADKKRDAPTALYLSELDNMFDIALLRREVRNIHTPGVVYMMLLLVGWVCSMLAGLRMSEGESRSWIHIYGFAFIAALAVYIILELEMPRFGFVQVESMDRVLMDLRKTME